MDSKQNESTPTENYSNTVVQTNHLSISKTCLSGMIMGFIAYSGSFSTVPIVFTITALIFGTKSWITIFATAFGQLAAGYLHTHSSRTGIAISTRIFRGFYIAKPELKNRRRHGETRCQSLKRFFLGAPINALVLNFMWETFTFYYFIQSDLYVNYAETLTSQKTKDINASLSANELERHLLIVQCITRYFAGCLSGMSTGLINQLWQRYLAREKVPHAVFNTDTKKLKLEWHERRKLLSPFNLENWIKVSVMSLGALFIIASNIPNATGFHLINLRTKRRITDILVIHGGWLFIRDGATLVVKKAEKAPKIPSNTEESSITVEQSKMMEDEQSNMLANVV